MKTIIAMLFAITGTVSYGQNLKKITQTFNVPAGWKSELITDSAYMPMFGKKMVAKWIFECKKKKLQPVEFYIFSYVSKDSADMEQKSMMYYAMSNCLVASNENIKQNSMNFSKGGYYFVEKMCPCYTTGSMECRTMVRQLFDWIEGKDKTKEF